MSGLPSTTSPNNSHADIEISSQPEIWEQVAQFYPQVAGLFPAKGARVAVVGCGSSWFMSQAFARLREENGFGETDSYTAKEFLPKRKYDFLIAITRSGTTSETVELLSQYKGESMVLTGVAGSPVTQYATKSIVMDFADEKSVVQTRWATSALGLLRSSLGWNFKNIIEQGKEELASDISNLLDIEQVTFLGNGWTVGMAQEAALKTREAAQFWAEAYPSFDYRHGPMSIAQKGRLVWAFGELDSKLAGEIQATGAILETSKNDPIAHMVKAQRLAIALGKKKGLNPDQPRGLARSVILG